MINFAWFVGFAPASNPRITLTTSIPTSTDKPYSVLLAKHRTAP
jgi:cell division protein FtsI/penicillin-binding protein 2